MKFDENLTAIHAYLCADGYLIKNPPTQKHKYYRIGFRNTNLVLLKDFQEKFEKVFRLKPFIRKEGRCEKSSKEIYEKLTKKFGSFYSYHWTAPKLNNKLSKIWLRAFFDCEGWIFCKTHQNRHIGLDSVNEEGINQIIILLKGLEIKVIKRIIKNRNIYRILIYGEKNLIKFKEKIGFLHPEKSLKLDLSIGDYIKYLWDFPQNEKECKKFIIKKLKDKIRIKKPYYIRIITKEKENLDKLKYYLERFYDINSLVYKRINGIGTTYYELNINKKDEVKKLTKLKLIPNLFK